MYKRQGPAGAALEDECLRVARDHDMRLIGPNCVGLLDTHRPLDTTFLPPPGPTPGDVAFISHSGAICAAVIDWARGQGFGLSHLVSLGNQIDVRETDVLSAVAADDHTRVITLYLEGISDGRRFVHAARRVTQHKPIIALKVGRFAAGQRAVASHTGALAGQESAFNAAFRRAGVIRANTSEELFDWARALAWCPLPAGRDVAVPVSYTHLDVYKRQDEVGQRRRHQRHRPTKIGDVAASLPVDDLPQKGHGDNHDDDAHQIGLQIVKVVNLQPIR